MNRPNSQNLFLIASLAVGLSYLPWLGLQGVVGSSEAREAHVVSLLCSGADWILPLRNGLVPSKPVLFHWLGAGVCSLGISPLIAARIVSLISSILILFITARLAALLGSKESGEARGLLAIWILSTTYLFINGTLDARVDMFFSLWVTLAIAIVLGAILKSTGPLESAQLIPVRDWIVFWLVCGIAVFAKGPLGMVLPVFVVALSFVTIFGFKRAASFLFRPTLGWISFACMALPWYVLAAGQGGEAFVGRQLVFENIQRLFGGEFVNAQPWYFYIPEFLFGALPWSAAFLAALFIRARNSASLSKIYSQERYRRQLRNGTVLIWFAGGFVLFSLATGKRPSYLLPLMPAMAAWTASVLLEWWHGLPGKRLMQFKHSLVEVNKFLCFIFFIVVLVVIELSSPRLWNAFGRADFYSVLLPSVQYAAIAGGGAALVLIGFIILGCRNASEGIGRVQWAVIPLLISFCVWFGFSIKGNLKGFTRMAERISHEANGEALTVVRSRNDEYFDPVLFLIGRSVTLQDPENAPEQCHGLFLHRASFSLWDTCRCGEIDRFLEWYNGYKGRREKEIVLSRCE